jgi:hypothetical protein
MDLGNPLQFSQLAQNPILQSELSSIPTGLMKHLNPLDWFLQAHINVMGGPPELGDGCISPLVQHDLPGIDKPQKAHQNEEKCDRQQQEEYQPVLEAFHPKEMHSATFFGNR